MAPAFKRFIDLVVAVVVIVLTIPVMLATAALILVTMGRPVLFRQPRPGLRGRTFVLFKFRTMLPPASDAERWKYDNRLTPLGRFLRKTSLDELPQLFNVVRGELSLVGPRPLMCEYLPLYNARQARRHEVRPGITGWAQINGRDSIGMEERFDYDVWYVDNWSFQVDARILGRTLVQVLTRRDAPDDGAPITPLWQGNSK